MNDTLMLLQMIKNGDVGTSDSNTIVCFDDYADVFFREVSEAIDQEHINLTSSFSQLWEVLNTLTNKTTEQLVKIKIIVIPTVSNNHNWVEVNCRPIILSNFTFTKDDAMYCDLEFIGKSSWENTSSGEYWRAKGVIKGLAHFWHEELRGGTPGDLSIDHGELDATLGVNSIKYDEHWNEAEATEY